MAITQLPVQTKTIADILDPETLALQGGKIKVIGGTGGGAVASVNGKTGTVVLAKSDVGLSNVDNTSDAAKPISTLTAAALALKQDSLGYANQAALHAGMDARFARIFTSMPAGTVGANGDYGILNAAGYRAVLITKTAGTWGVVSESFTFAQMQAIASPAEGMTVFCSTINWGSTTYAVNTLFRRTGSAWVPLYRCSIYKLAADSASITNSVQTFQACVTLTPPTGLFTNGRDVFLNGRTKTTLDGTPTHTPQVFIGGSLFASSFANVDKQWRGNCHMWTRTANKLRVGGGADGFNLTAAGNSSAESATFDGSTVTMQIGATFSATGSNTTICYEHLLLELVP